MHLVLCLSNAIVRFSVSDCQTNQLFRLVNKGPWYRGADAVMIVYDVTNRTSFNNVPNWLGEISGYLDEGFVCMLVGNKSDRASERRVEVEEGMEMAANHAVVGFIERDLQC